MSTTTGSYPVLARPMTHPIPTVDAQRAAAPAAAATEIATAAHRAQITKTGGGTEGRNIAAAHEKSPQSLEL